MKKIKLNILQAACFILFFAAAKGQEYKVPSAGKTLTVVLNDINKVEVEGTTGTDIIFTTSDGRREKNERAEGLKAISALGLSDNTGIGLSVVETGGRLEVNQISRNSNARFHVKVPKSVSVKYTHSSVYGSTFYARNIESELDVSTNHNSVWLENVTGPMTVNTVHGKIEASFTSLNQTTPTSIVSVHGLIDITLPANTKADLRLDTRWGEIFTDMDIDIEQTSELRRLSAQTIRGKINGGGVRLNISSTHSNIYLRKKK